MKRARHAVPQHDARLTTHDPRLTTLLLAHRYRAAREGRAVRLSSFTPRV